MVINISSSLENFADDEKVGLNINILGTTECILNSLSSKEEDFFLKTTETQSNNSCFSFLIRNF